MGNTKKIFVDSLATSDVPGRQSNTSTDVSSEPSMSESQQTQGRFKYALDSIRERNVGANFLSALLNTEGYQREKRREQERDDYTRSMYAFSKEEQAQKRKEWAQNDQLHERRLQSFDNEQEAFDAEESQRKLKDMTARQAMREQDRKSVDNIVFSQINRQFGQQLSTMTEQEKTKFFNSSAVRNMSDVTRWGRMAAAAVQGKGTPDGDAMFKRLQDEASDSGYALAEKDGKYFFTSNGEEHELTEDNAMQMAQQAQQQMADELSAQYQMSMQNTDGNALGRTRLDMTNKLMPYIGSTSDALKMTDAFMQGIPADQRIILTLRQAAKDWSDGSLTDAAKQQEIQMCMPLAQKLGFQVQSGADGKARFKNSALNLDLDEAGFTQYLAGQDGSTPLFEKQCATLKEQKELADKVKEISVAQETAKLFNQQSQVKKDELTMRELTRQAAVQPEKDKLDIESARLRNTLLEKQNRAADEELKAKQKVTDDFRKQQEQQAKIQSDMQAFQGTEFAAKNGGDDEKIQQYRNIDNSLWRQAFDLGIAKQDKGGSLRMVEDPDMTKLDALVVMEQKIMKETYPDDDIKPGRFELYRDRIKAEQKVGDEYLKYHALEMLQKADKKNETTNKDAFYAEAKRQGIKINSAAPAPFGIAAYNYTIPVEYIVNNAFEHFIKTEDEFIKQYGPDAYKKLRMKLKEQEKRK